LADRTQELGYGISRTTISELENGKRKYVTVAELVVLAAALDTAPILLLYPGPHDRVINVLPHIHAPELQAAAWFSMADSSALLPAELPNDADAFAANTKRLRIAIEIAQLEAEKESAVRLVLGPADKREQAEQRLGVHMVRVVDGLTAQIESLRAELKEGFSDGG